LAGSQLFQLFLLVLDFEIKFVDFVIRASILAENQRRRDQQAGKNENQKAYFQETAGDFR
jgi:hypothetical protein